MKKILLILCLLFSFSQSYSVAFWCEENECSIWDVPAEALTDYVSDLSRILNNISAEARADENKKILSNVKSQALRITNATAGFKWYFSSFDYYIAYPISHDIPYQIERDHTLLINQNKRILSTIQKILRSGWWNVTVKDICNGIDANKCSIESATAESILATLLKNNKKIIYLYQLNVLGKTARFTDDILFVNSDFKQELSKHYGPDNIKACSSCEWAFGNKMDKSIEKIWNISDESESAVAKWKYAWAVLGGNEKSAQDFLTRTGSGTRTDYYRESLALWEEDVLKRYLWETWAGAKASEVALQNLQRYNENKAKADDPNYIPLNNEKLSTNNPLENTARNTFSDIKTQIDSFEESVVQSYTANKIESSDFGIPTTQVKSVQDKIQTTQTIKDNIAKLYTAQKSINLPQDSATEGLMGKMIQMHSNLIAAINTLGEITDTSEKVCNAQWKWLWLCSYQ